MTDQSVAHAPSRGPERPRGALLRSPAAVSAATYTGLSLAAALTFLIITLLSSDYSWVARIGGSVWIFALCMVILMPTITPWIRERMNR